MSKVRLDKKLTQNKYLPKAKPSKEKNVSVSYTVYYSANVWYGKNCLNPVFRKFQFSVF